VHHGYWTSRLSNFAIQGLNARPLNPRVFSSAALCVSAARASIHLIKYVPQGDFACVWLILYFPVSALMTLFGNILQNPQDPRARSDVRLMNLVVGFLSMLGVEEENGGVKRMLGVCAEFERIAKVVLDKSDRESSSRKKRKSHEDSANKVGNGPKPIVQNTPMPAKSHPPMNFSTASSNGLQSHVNEQTGFSPLMNGSSPANNGWVPESNFSDGTEFMSPNAGLTPFGDMQGFMNGNVNSPLNPNTFQQPFVPPDLWQMPMTLEWDWADVTGGQYPSFENGQYGNQGLQNGNMHQQQ